MQAVIPVHHVSTLGCTPYEGCRQTMQLITWAMHDTRLILHSWCRSQPHRHDWPHTQVRHSIPCTILLNKKDSHQSVYMPQLGQSACGSGDCRYVWLPMWVEDNSAAQQDTKVSAWSRLNPFASARTIPPVEVEVHWYDAWSMSHLSMNQTSRQTQQQDLKATPTR